MNREPGKGLFLRVIFLSFFGIAMGFLEASVVIYLRELYYPEGFAFPVKPVIVGKLSVEYLREISTIVMLFSISMLTGRNLAGRFATFLYSFGVWDIFYYVWLKVLLDWPSTLLTWDILFLIPVVWVGPVLAPIICSLTMISIAACITYFSRKGYKARVLLYERGLFVAGALLIFTTFVWDYSRILIQGRPISGLLTLRTSPALEEIIAHYVPATYNWPLFVLGEVLIVAPIISIHRRMKKHNRDHS
jgi:hypothetical protein